MLGNALPDISLPWDIDRALEQAGFEILENDDPGRDDPHRCAGGTRHWAHRNSRPWDFLKTPAGRRATAGLMWLLERIGLAPRGAHHVATILNRGANALTRGGQLGIFTPMYFTVARKPSP